MSNVLETIKTRSSIRAYGSVIIGCIAGVLTGEKKAY